MNVRKHAGVDRVEVTVERGVGELCVTVADTGRGFELAALDHQGFGLRTMQERAQAVGGTVDIESAPGSGTRVIARIPRIWRNGRMG